VLYLLFNVIILHLVPCLIACVAVVGAVCVNGAADVNTVVLAIERLVSDCGGLTVVVGRPCHDSGSSATTCDNSAVYAVFTRETVSRCNIERGSVIAVHPPWLSLLALVTYLFI